MGLNMKNALLATGGATVIGLAAFAGVASAATNSSTSGDQTLVDKLATKFNLNKSEVQAVFDEDRAAHEAQMEQKMEDRLAEAVKNGKITEEQKSQILAKHKEMKAYMESLKDKTEEERRTLMKEKMQELRQWAEDNGLTEYMMAIKVGGPGHGFGGPGGPTVMKLKLEAGEQSAQ
jgi:hypothetical protein